MKHKHTLTRSKTALLVIDVQEKFSPVIPDFDGMVTNITRLVLTFEMFDMPIVVTEQYPEGLGNTVAKIGEQFTMLEVVEKMELDAMENSHFRERLNKIGCDTFVVCGIETHVCVNQTVLALLAMGKTVHVVADAVGSRHAIDQTVGMRKMENAGALVTSTETVLFELAGRAGTDSFKNIQTMVKSSKMKPGPAAQKATKKGAGHKDPLQKPESKPVPGIAQEKAVAPPAPTAYDDMVDVFEPPAAAAVEKTPAPKAAPAQHSPDAKAEEDTKALAEPVRSPSSGAKVDEEAVDIDDMLAEINKKIDTKEPIGKIPADEIDKDIADLDDIIKAEEKIEKEPPDPEIEVHL
jgi:nicotinamidase-related amidase